MIDYWILVRIACGLLLAAFFYGATQSWRDWSGLSFFQWHIHILSDMVRKGFAQVLTMFVIMFTASALVFMFAVMVGYVGARFF